METQNSEYQAAIMPTYGRIDLSFVRGEGCYLITDDNIRYLDCASGIAVNTLGHCHPKLVETLSNQAHTLWHTSNLYRIPDQERLAFRLAQACKLDHVFFCNSGAEANEASVKMARRFQYRQNKQDKTTILCASGAFHGRTLGMLSATANPAYREGFGPSVAGFEHVAFGNLNELRAAINEKTAAIMIEPVQGEGGANAAPDGYLQGLREAADEFGVLVIADEVQTGMGRTGSLFAFQKYGIQPDIVALAKGLGGGIPVGAVVARADIGNAMGPGSHGSTFGGNPLAMAVANSVVDILQEDGFLQHVQEISSYLNTYLVKLSEQYPSLIKEIKGLGLLRGIGLQECFAAADLSSALRDKHILTVQAGLNTLRIIPPLIITKSEIDILCNALTICFEEKSHEL
ncbi:aspartate aminotransferase family protein [Alphaproteobacteria bacterium]|nr:aspartate aminotransferase family protein [Alphaproteobacteria bacterium]